MSYSKLYPKHIDYNTPIIAEAAYNILDNSAEKFPHNVAINLYIRSFLKWCIYIYRIIFFLNHCVKPDDNVFIIVFQCA